MNNKALDDALSEEEVPKQNRASSVSSLGEEGNIAVMTPSHAT